MDLITQHWYEFLQRGRAETIAGFFFFQAEDGIRDRDVTGVQTCGLPICPAGIGTAAPRALRSRRAARPRAARAEASGTRRSRRPRSPRRASDRFRPAAAW